MPTNSKPLNPYIAGSALDSPEGFFGREDVLRLVETELRSPHQNAVVLFGQRRIGKTSVLLQLRRRLPESGFLPVYLDLMDRARRSLGAVLAALAGEVALELGLEPPQPEHFDDEGRYFRQEFLPAAYAALGQGEAARRLVFLFDEFDVLDLAAVEELPDTAAARAFFPFIRELMALEKRLGFVIVVGRKTEELSTDFRVAFRAARYQRVSVLDEQDARAVIHLAEEVGTLRYTAPAVNRILALTAGHPYFTQLTCFVLFSRAWADTVQGIPQVGKADVDAVVPQVLEAGNNAFEWVWDGLPPAERIIFSAIAEGTEEGQVLNEDQIVAVLQEHGIRILIRELELAPRTLVDWEMLRRVDDGYRFFIELMRRWVARHKPLTRVRDELDRVDVVADQLYRLGLTYYRQDNLRVAIEQLREAVTANPNHLQARLLLGQCLRELGDLAEAIKELEWAYEYDAQASRYDLVRTLLQQGECLEKDGLEDEALAVYKRILEVSPRERVARERRAAIYEKSGDAALEADDYDAALAAYELAGAEEKLRQVEARKRRAELEADDQRGEQAARAEDWATAVKIYTRLVTQDPDNSEWQRALEEAQREQRLAVRYAEGLGAIEQQQLAKAQRSLADVVHEQPDYKEASRYLHLAVAFQDAATLQAEFAKERKAREVAEQELETVKTFPFRYLSTWGRVAMVAVAVALLAVGGLAGALLTREPSTGAPVVIVSPPSNSKVLLDTENEVVIVVRADEGVTRVELEVDGIVVAEYPPEGADFLYDSPVSLRWTADAVGERTLTVKPLDANNKPGEAVSIVVEVVEPTLTPTDTPPPTETFTPTPSNTPTITPTRTSTSTQTATDTPTLTPTATPFQTPTPTREPTNTPTPTFTPLPGHVPGTGTIAGQVLWNETPVPGIQLTVYENAPSPRFETDISANNSGEFVVDNVPPGAISVGPVWNDPVWSGGILFTVEPNIVIVEKVYVWKEDLQIMSPTDGAVVDNQPTVTWKAYPDAAKYRVGYSVGRPCSEQEGCTTSWTETVRNWVTGTSWTVPQQLDSGMYWFWVYAYNEHEHIIAKSDATVEVP